MHEVFFHQKVQPEEPPSGVRRAWQPPRTVRELAQRLWRQRRPMALYFVAVMGLVTAVTLSMRPQYRSESKLFVRVGRENLGLDPTTMLGQTGGVLANPGPREDEINSMVEMFGSRSLLERLADEIGPARLLDRDPVVSPTADAPSVGVEPTFWSTVARLGRGRPDPRNDAVEYLRRHTSVSAQRRSNVISVSFTGASPELAQTVVQRLVDLYQDDYARLHRVEGSREFLAAQAGLLRKRLAAAEARLQALKKTTGLTSVADQRRILVERIGGLEDALLQADSQLAVTDAEARTLAQRLKTLPTMLETERATGFSNEALDGMRQQLYTLQLKEQELLSKYRADATAVQEVRRQLTEARAILERENAQRTQVRSSRNPTYQQLELAYLTAQTTSASLRAKRDAVGEQLQQARQRLTALTANEGRLADAQREVELEEGKYRRYTDTTEQARVDEELEHERLSNIGVVQPATLEPKPVRPRVMLNLSVGFLAALLGAFALGGIGDYREGTAASHHMRSLKKVRPYPREVLSAWHIDLLLHRQRARSDRNGECFALLVFGWRDKSALETGVDALEAVLFRRLRATDDVGWLDEERLCVLLHDAVPQAARAIADDVTARYPKHLPALQTEVYIYPSDAGESQSGRTPTATTGRGSRASDVSSVTLATVRRDGSVLVRPLDAAFFTRAMPWWKRLLDITVSCAALVLAAPVILLCAVAIKLESRGPAFFLQRRAGLGGQPFTIYKLRTMTADAEARHAGLVDRSERDGPFKMSRDPRVTRVGRFLRKTSLDELPQLWNVLLGNMSLVGPRPLPLVESNACAPWQRHRLDVTPGLTGMWQVSGRAHVAFTQWVRMDLRYIRSQSLAQDLKLLLLTIPAVTLRRGAH